MKKKIPVVETALFITLVFIILNGFHIISISWWWIFSPLWIPVALLIAIFLIVFFKVIINILYEEVMLSLTKKKVDKK